MTRKKIRSGGLYPSALLIFFCLPFCALAQQPATGKYTIRGRIIDSTSFKPVAYATLSILDSNRQVIVSSFSTETGTFAIQTGRPDSCVLEISSIGYRLREIRLLLIPAENELLLGDIHISPAGSQLEAVTVTARKKIIEVRPGMIVYNAENDVTNKGGTAADVLRKAPVLNVDAQGNVSMRGNSNLKILINGKYSGQMARSPADALNMMPADIIKSVEVITTPSAKYDAEGAAGVINIITKKGRKNSNGALELSGSNLEQMFNPRISVANDKWNFSFHGHLHRLRFREAARTERLQLENGQPVLQLHQAMNKDNSAPHGSGDLAIVFTPDSITEISLGVNTWFGNWPDDKQLETVVRLPDGTISEHYLQTADAEENYLGSDINVGYTRKFKKPGQEITLLTQFTPGGSKLPYHILLTDKTGLPQYEEVNSNHTRNREWTAQADYVQPFSNSGKYTLETGIKLIFRNVGTVYTLSATDPQGSGVLQPDPSRSDHFQYRQDVWAAYAMLKANLAKNWYVETGLRGEETILEGNFLHSGARFNNRFTNLVPTATLSKKITEEQTLTLSYTQRLTRPYIWDLNPNANASDPKNILAGNPRLQPETAHQAELTYGLNGGTSFFLNTALFWKQTDNAIVDFTQTDAAGISTTSKQNLAANKMYGLNLSSSLALSSKWNLNGNININYLDFKSDALAVRSKGWAADIDLNTTFKLPKRFSLQAFGEYNGRKVILQGYESFQYYYSLAVKKEITAARVNITLATTNPFSAYIPQKVTIRTAQFRALNENRYYLRSIKLTVNWEFGSMFGEKNRKKISNDDVKDPSKG